jgi:hypothetical protein
MDLHTKGIYAVADEHDKVLLDTVEETGYSARAEFLRKHNPGRWSFCQQRGYRIVRLEVVEVEQYEPY